MKEMIPLRTIEYNVPTKPLTGEPIKRSNPAHLLNIQVDFQTGQLQMDGNWKFIVGSNQRAERHWFGFHRERVKLIATVYPGQAVDLAYAKTGAAFAIEGKLSDADGEVEYCGLLLMDPPKANSKRDTGCWNITLYLYNSESDDCEIKLKWPFYPAAKHAELN